jgi:hypothetical protein
MADAYGFVFKPEVKDLGDAFNLLQKFREAGQSRMKIEERSQVSVGGKQAVYARGILHTIRGNKAPFEVVLLPAEGGIRGMMFTSIEKHFTPLQAERQVLLLGFRPTTPAEDSDSTSVPVTTFRDPSGIFSIDYPKSFVANRQALANYHQQGLTWFRFLGAKAADRADFALVAFGPPVRTTDQALGAIRTFERSVGCNMVSTAKERRSVGEYRGMWYAGTNTLPDGVRLRWEAVFVPSGAGVMGVVFSAPPEKWEALAAERAALFAGIKLKR